MSDRHAVSWREGVRFVQIWSVVATTASRGAIGTATRISTRDHRLPLSRGMAIGSGRPASRTSNSGGCWKIPSFSGPPSFGRMPSTQGKKGRDHNPYVFTNWLAGGGIRGGVTHGESDQWGYKPLDREQPDRSVYDILCHHPASAWELIMSASPFRTGQHRPPSHQRARPCDQGDPRLSCLISRFRMGPLFVR